MKKRGISSFVFSLAIVFLGLLIIFFLTNLFMTNSRSTLDTEKTKVNIFIVSDNYSVESIFKGQPVNIYFSRYLTLELIKKHDIDIVVIDKNLSDAEVDFLEQLITKNNVYIDLFYNVYLPDYFGVEKYTSDTTYLYPPINLTFYPNFLFSDSNVYILNYPVVMRNITCYDYALSESLNGQDAVCFRSNKFYFAYHIVDHRDLFSILYYQIKKKFEEKN
jgi:hypothetical protein